MRNHRTQLAFILVGLTALGGLSSGCFESEEPTCAYWVPKLQSPSKGDKALEMVEELKCTEALPELDKMFEQGQNREQIVRMVKQLDDRKGAVPILRKALKVRKTVKLAAGIVQDWKLADVRQELEDILLKPKLPEARTEALKALLAIEKPAALEDLLIKVAGGDINVQGRKVTAMAIEELGRLHSKKALPTLVRAAFARSTRGEKVYQVVRQALAQIGLDSVPLLVDTIAGRNKDLIQFARDNGIFEWEWKEGPEIIQLLTDTLDPRVAKPIVANMHMNLAPPVGLSEANSEAWRRAQVNRFTTIMLGLGHVGAPEAIEPLIAVIKDKDADDVNQRLKAASALAYIGTPEAVDAVFTLFEAEENPLVKSQLVFPLCEALDAAHLDQFDKLKDIKKPSARIKTSLGDETVKGYLPVVRECKTDAGCLIKKLDSKNKWETVKAALLLMRGTYGERDTVIKALLARFAKADKGDIDIRRFTLMALTRLGDDKTGRDLLELADQQPKGDKYWPGELRAFGNYMIHRGPRKAVPAPAPAADDAKAKGHGKHKRKHR